MQQRAQRDSRVLHTRASLSCFRRPFRSRHLLLHLPFLNGSGRSKPSVRPSGNEASRGKRWNAHFVATASTSERSGLCAEPWSKRERACPLRQHTARKRDRALSKHRRPTGCIATKTAAEADINEGAGYQRDWGSVRAWLPRVLGGRTARFPLRNRWREVCRLRNDHGLARARKRSRQMAAMNCEDAEPAERRTCVYGTPFGIARLI